ncbi:Ribonuclease H-like domain containing protein [Trema orientale]|uniref:Ribonuclease H-like domain containing protein n=1 Tax=Trema orientale TaxID=63057 RepID=A0A2P5FSW9_TREOI|nr:Ribonuclease H-like domain containing protein [Trema orientale]
MGQLKLNIDTAVKCSSGFIGIGVVVRDCIGMVLCASSLKFAGHLSPFLAECVAVREGIKFAINHGLSPGVIETDAQNVVLALQEKTFNALEGPVVRDISRLLERLGNASCHFICRSCNEAAHSLAQFTFRNNVSQSWFDSIPDWLTTNKSTIFHSKKKKSSESNVNLCFTYTQKLNQTT